MKKFELSCIESINLSVVSQDAVMLQPNHLNFLEIFYNNLFSLLLGVNTQILLFFSKMDQFFLKLFVLMAFLNSFSKDFHYFFLNYLFFLIYFNYFYYQVVFKKFYNISLVILSFLQTFYMFCTFLLSFSFEKCS